MMNLNPPGTFKPMKTATNFLRHAGLASILGFLMTVFAHAQSGNLSVITGRVSNAATQASLEGAVVRLEGTSYEVLTERDGTYVLRVPAGTYQMSVSYTGLDQQTIPVTGAGGTQRHDVALTSNIYKMDTFIVSTEREEIGRASCRVRL